MDFEIRRLRAEEVPSAMELAWDTFLRFEAPDYGPEGVETFRRTVIENEVFLEKCRSVYSSFPTPCTIFVLELTAKPFPTALPPTVRPAASADIIREIT